MMPNVCGRDRKKAVTEWKSVYHPNPFDAVCAIVLLPVLDYCFIVETFNFAFCLRSSTMIGSDRF